MTLVPYGPLWCWNLSGENAVYFSQPTLEGDSMSLVPISGAGTCVWPGAIGPLDWGTLTATPGPRTFHAAVWPPWLRMARICASITWSDAGRAGRAAPGSRTGRAGAAKPARSRQLWRVSAMRSSPDACPVRERMAVDEQARRMRRILRYDHSQRTPSEAEHHP
jgi:hypothetical protein